MEGLRFEGRDSEGFRLRLGEEPVAAAPVVLDTGETAGFIKVVVDAETDRLLGAAVLANDGAELVHIYIDLMNAGAPYQAIRDAVHIHPTLAEAVQSAVSALD